VEIGSKEVGFFLKKKPHQAVTLERKTAWAKSIFACLSSIRQKLSKLRLTDRTLDGITFIFPGKKFHSQRADTLQKGSGNVTNDERNDVFNHASAI
jgi:hypothetical protein